MTTRWMLVACAICDFILHDAVVFFFFFFFQAEDGIRDYKVTGVQTCALPICYGFLLDIRDPAHPVRIAAVADSNFSYWHSATFNNTGTKMLFSDEWGGGGQPKCRATDRREWGADAIFTIVDANGAPVMAHDGMAMT